jgi:hypothetical protein
MLPKMVKIEHNYSWKLQGFWVWRLGAARRIRVRRSGAGSLLPGGTFNAQHSTFNVQRSLGKALDIRVRQAWSGFVRPKSPKKFMIDDLRYTSGVVQAIAGGVFERFSAGSSPAGRRPALRKQVQHSQGFTRFHKVSHEFPILFKKYFNH